MTAKSKMSLRPPKTTSEDKLRQFIEEPDEKFKTDPEPEETVEPAPAPQKRTAKKPKAQEREPYPWEEPGVIPDIVKAFTVRIKFQNLNHEG